MNDELFVNLLNLLVRIQGFVMDIDLKEVFEISDWFDVRDRSYVFDIDNFRLRCSFSIHFIVVHSIFFSVLEEELNYLEILGIFQDSVVLDLNILVFVVVFKTNEKNYPRKLKNGTTGNGIAFRVFLVD